MAGSKLNNYSTTYTSLTWMQLAIDGQRKGYTAISLTNMSTTSVPAISAGGECEVNGALFSFSSEENISTTSLLSTSNMQYYIELVPSSSLCTSAFTSLTPVWRDSLYGYYRTSTSNNRIIGGVSFYNGNYLGKYLYTGRYPMAYQYQTITISTSVAFSMVGKTSLHLFETTFTIVSTFNYIIQSCLFYNIHWCWSSSALSTVSPDYLLPYKDHLTVENITISSLNYLVFDCCYQYTVYASAIVTWTVNIFLNAGIIGL